MGRYHRASLQCAIVGHAHLDWEVNEGKYRFARCSRCHQWVEWTGYFEKKEPQTWEQLEQVDWGDR